MDVNKYIETQVEYFRKNSRPNGKSYLGVEFEHFLVDRESLRSYSYFEAHGQKEIVEGLLKKNNGWKLISEEDGYPLGLEKDGSTITFEPGGQMEISLKTFERIQDVQAAYQEIIDDIYTQLMPSQMLVTIGYHPKTKIEELPILPKKRYGMMFEYFKTHGAKSHNMMKGTSSTQVSIDYINEEDFIKKYRVAHFLAPVLADIFDSTPVFEGEIYAKENARVAIWAETDPPRSKLVPGTLSTKFDFKSYAVYLLDVAPIFISKDGKEIFTREATLRELLKEYTFTEKELEHIMSMVFPDVRLKKFIEIRMADALPYPYGLAVVAIIKGIFYNSTILEEFYKKALLFDDSWVIEQNKALINNPQKVDQTFTELKNIILSDVVEVLPEDEKKYVEPFIDLIKEHGSVAKWLKDMHKATPKLFAKTIEVPCSKKEEL